MAEPLANLAGSGEDEAGAPMPAGLVLTPQCRRPMLLAAETEAAVRAEDFGRWLDPRPDPVAVRASIIVPTSNNLTFLKFCLVSVLANTTGLDYELLVIDNGSSDATPDWLAALARTQGHLHVIGNAVNRGFGPAVNQGLLAARGELIVLLNDDTIVLPGWLERLGQHLSDPAIGLLGPVTNRAGSDAQIHVSYTTYGELRGFAADRLRSRAGELRDVEMVTMFCLAMRREAYERIGALDERFAVGMFEDDDYAARAQREGYRIVCAEDVFVHHFGATSLGRLAATGDLGQLFESNRRRFEEKWQTTWVSRRQRTTPEYERLIDDVRELVGRQVPAGARVAVITRGDDLLIDLPGCIGWHFPQSADGTYAGYHPADGEEAIAALEAVRRRGAEYLLVPATMRWWLDHYASFGEHLRERHRVMVDAAAGVLVALAPAESAAEAGSLQR